jgi:hypothetical protein
VQAQNREIGLIELHACNSRLDLAGNLGFSLNVMALVGLSSPELLPNFSYPLIILIVGESEQV